MSQNELKTVMDFHITNHVDIDYKEIVASDYSLLRTYSAFIKNTRYIDSFNNNESNYYLYTSHLVDASSAGPFIAKKYPTSSSNINYKSEKIYDSYIQIGCSTDKGSRKFFNLSNKLNDEQKKNYFQIDTSLAKGYGDVP
jgi:hypothetical protein